MADDHKDRSVRFDIYDPENLPYEKQCICEIIRDLPEVTPEEISGYHDD
jgi:hypothetical protein